MSDQKRLHVWFSGRVQGVGFRYTTAQIADRYPITGWVKNLSDGRVEMAAEGIESDLEAFVADIRKTMGSYIQDIERHWETPTGKESSFRITY